MTRQSDSQKLKGKKLFARRNGRAAGPLIKFAPQAGTADSNSKCPEFKALKWGGHSGILVELEALTTNHPEGVHHVLHTSYP